VSKAVFPEMEAKLDTESELLELLDPEASSHFSDGWFDGFKQRHRISFRHSTNVSQGPAKDKERSFHKNVR
jgi:hypothetical protein